MRSVLHVCALLQMGPTGNCWGPVRLIGACGAAAHAAHCAAATWRYVRAGTSAGVTVPAAPSCVGYWLACAQHPTIQETCSVTNRKHNKTHELLKELRCKCRWLIWVEPNVAECGGASHLLYSLPVANCSPVSKWQPAVEGGQSVACNRYR
jgi:hypothetical protein